jgi:hypothetical protein
VKNYVSTILLLINFGTISRVAVGAELGCAQNQFEQMENNLDRTYTIEPARVPRAFYEWYNNNGYCGEVSMIQAGMAFGQWTSQFNARLFCASGLSQTGPDGYCAAHNANPNYNSQMLLESPRGGDQRFASAPACLDNFSLESSHFETEKQASGKNGYKQYMSWIKQRLIEGQIVAIGVTHKGHDSPEYDHIVTVVKIATNHDPENSEYFDDDVIYFDDHGSNTFQNGKLSPHHPPIPFAASQTPDSCDPYIYAYSFGRLAHSRAEANADGAPLYSIIIPGSFPIKTGAGGDGENPRREPIVGGNYAFAVRGPQDLQKNTLPVWLEVAQTSDDKGQINPVDPIVGLNYENPMAGTDIDGNSCTNDKPAPMKIRLRVHVIDLIPGQRYNIYLYKIDSSLVALGIAKTLVPSSHFNSPENLNKPSAVYRIKASAPTHEFFVDALSDQSLYFRAVSALAP